MTSETAKISISMPRDLAEEARRRGGRGGLSAYVTEAVSWALERERLREIIEAVEAESGPITDEEIAAAHRTVEEAHRQLGHGSGRRGAA